MAWNNVAEKRNTVKGRSLTAWNEEGNIEKLTSEEKWRMVKIWRNQAYYYSISQLFSIWKKMKRKSSISSVKKILKHGWRKALSAWEEEEARSLLKKMKANLEGWREEGRSERNSVNEGRSYLVKRRRGQYWLQFWEKMREKYEANEMKPFYKWKQESENWRESWEKQKTNREAEN